MKATRPPLTQKERGEINVYNFLLAIIVLIIVLGCGLYILPYLPRTFI
jgi:hypothetical protein